MHFRNRIFIPLSSLCWLVFLCSFSSLLFSQSGDRYFIRLNHKNNTAYSLANPQQFLSQRAIDRRTRQNIAIDSTDIPVDTAYVRQIRTAGATVLYTSRWFNAVVAVIPNATVLSAVNTLPFVINSNPVNRYKSDKETETIFPFVSSERGTSTASLYNYGPSLNQISMLNGVCMHDQGYNGEGMQIAVLDAGYANANVHSAFDSLRANNQILDTIDFTFNFPPSLFSPSTSGHGTAVLSCMAGNKPGQLVGTAPKAKYWLFRSEYAPNEYIVEEYNWVGAAECADSVGADIINSSLGYNQFDNSGQDHVMSQLDGKTSYASRAATMCARKGMIVCNSAGNTGGSGWPKITFPGDADSIITVGAVDPNRNYASFSSIGPSADGRVKPDVMAQGLGSVVAVGVNTISTSSGTSFSSPITAGMVACLWQANPLKTNMEIINAIRQSANLFEMPNNQFGYGIPDYCKADDILKGVVDTIVIPAPVFVTSLVLSSSNPFRDEVRFTLTTAADLSFTVKIYDITGKLVLKENRSVKAEDSTEYIINTGSLSVGAYVMKITATVSGEEKVWQYKLLKVQN
ncbi:MAG: peptidase [Bacteroidetes bacterium]|jgi:subtilisin family serine protease|nr:peptidase [Bacteroidota bacterium]